jgi:outer membrane protein assembly factor BamB/tRNA A-37 threonylcarbamoyl transferase component Bud32
MTDKPSQKSDNSLLPAQRDDRAGESRDDLSTRRIDGSPPSLSDRVTRIVGDPNYSREDGQLKEGMVLQERYRIVEVIGAGGMSTVYQARDLRFAQVTRLCAVKEMTNLAHDPQIRERNLRNFEREASILATLNHPAVPQVYDYFSEGSHSYLVQEFIQGQDLETVLDSMEGFLSESQVISWALQVCDVLIYLHNHQPDPIVFRDLKPSNIMVDERQRIRLIDFGIAKVFQAGLKGTMIGTEGYSPPEQYRGIADPRGDLYSLAATLHHLLTKQDPRLEPPFSFQERPIHMANPRVSEELVEIIERALSYDVDDRFGSAEEMRQALASLRTAGPKATSLLTTSFKKDGAPAPVWNFACEDEVRSSPVVEKGVLYIGAYDNNLYALDAESGDFLWKYAADGGIGSSPCVSADTVFVGSQDHSLYAINAQNGRLLWTCPTQGPIYSSPRAQFGHVFFGSDDCSLYGVKISSGRVAWTVGVDAPIRSTPALGQKAIYFGDESGSVYAIGSGGRRKWRFRTRRAVTSSPLLAGDTLYVGSKDGYFYALDTQNGWDVWRYRAGGAIISSPAASDSAVFFGGVNGDVYALSLNSGRVKWRYETGGQVTSSPFYYRGAVYIGSADGALYAIDAKKGKLQWRFDTQGPVISSPRVAGDIVYFGSLDRHVYALPV